MLKYRRYPRDGSRSGCLNHVVEDIGVFLLVVELDLAMLSLTGLGDGPGGLGTGRVNSASDKRDRQVEALIRKSVDLDSVQPAVDFPLHLATLQGKLVILDIIQCFAFI
ncbi:Uu.00g119760.m01.CDS01 [Anthostomella pinea]|uniref:Uu.00g119760.m01.CDS01 n=1 Tax=Anthostomella pinea TaxID=933095 RepID=A0AAI8VBF5_9PEZI|nr:Uu.00g119760.m01.CDS01 [Anthostomella pinea]